MCKVLTLDSDSSNSLKFKVQNELLIDYLGSPT